MLFMAKIHLIEGPVGAGKSTFATRLGYEIAAPRFDLDEWMITLFRPDRPDTDFMLWYSERKWRCIEQIWRTTSELVGSGTDTVLELGLVQREDRAEFYNRVDVSDFELAVYVLDSPEEVRRQRVWDRNSRGGDTFKMEVPDEIFELANNAWQAPDELECYERDIQIIHTHDN